MIFRDNPSDNAGNPTQINYPPVDVHTLQENNLSKVRSVVDNVMTSVETRIYDAVLTAIESLLIPRVESGMRSSNALSERSLSGR